MSKILFSFLFRCECYDYLFEVAVEMKKSGLDPCEIPVPPEGAYTQV